MLNFDYKYLRFASAISTRYTCVTEDIIPIPCNTLPIQIHTTDPPLNPTVIHPLSSGIHNKMIVGRRPSQFDKTPVAKEPPSCPRLLRLAKNTKKYKNGDQNLNPD